MENYMSIDKAVLNEDTEGTFIRSMMQSLVQVTRASNNLPSVEGSSSEFDYLRTFRECSENMDSLSEEVASLIRDLCYFSRAQTGSKLLSADLLDPTVFSSVIDTIDDILEHADIKLDEVAGIDTSKRSYKLRDIVDKDRVMYANTLNLDKPQENFDTPVDNERDAPHVPILWGKPNSIVPLQKSINNTSHIYEAEMRMLDYETLLGEESVPREPFSFPTACAEHPFEYIDTEAALQALADILKANNYSEIAIDLENHSYRSFLGFSCLMQLSTRDKDYVIDTVALRAHMGLLLDVFTDPHVVKVFHGCHNDILWLQRDFGLYVVNCLDTYQASKLLKYPALSLAHLLKYYCGITVNKKHQLADWRQRPLSAELMQYARDDTHYLLYIFDCLRRDIVREHGMSGLCAVFDASRRTCLMRYEKDQFDRLGYLQLFQDPRRNVYKIRAAELTATQDSILMCLWDWRDRHARESDESPAYIMSDSELVRLGMLPQLPRSADELAKAGQPLSGYVMQRLDAVLKVIHDAVHGGPASSGGPLNDTASASKKTAPSASNKNGMNRAGFLSVRGPSSGAGSRLKELSSISKFTPTIEPVDHSGSDVRTATVPPLSNGSRTGLSRGTPSPLAESCMDTDIKELLERAGWAPKRTATSAPTRNKPIFISEFREPVNPRAVTAYQNALALANSSVASELRPLTDEPSSDEDTGEAMDIDDNGDIANVVAIPEIPKQKEVTAATVNVAPADDFSTTDLPKSLSEIYNLSNANKKNRSRDKKRNRATAAAPESSPSSANAQAKANAMYFSKSTPVLASDGPVQEAASFLERVNWIDETGKSELIKKCSGHEQELQDATSQSTGNKSSVPPLKHSNNPQITAGKKTVANPFLNYSSNDMAAIGSMQSSRSSASGKKSYSRDKSVSNSASSASSTGGQKKSKNATTVERKKDQDRTHVFS